MTIVPTPPRAERARRRQGQAIAATVEKRRVQAVLANQNPRRRPQRVPADRRADDLSAVLTVEVTADTPPGSWVYVRCCEHHTQRGLIDYYRLARVLMVGRVARVQFADDGSVGRCVQFDQMRSLLAVA